MELHSANRQRGYFQIKFPANHQRARIRLASSTCGFDAKSLAVDEDGSLFTRKKTLLTLIIRVKYNKMICRSLLLYDSTHSVYINCRMEAQTIFEKIFAM
jgi:hypothetical protein